MTVTIINGATQGLGEAVARKLAADGATGVMLSGRSAQRSRALADDLTAAGTPTVFLEADMSDPETPARIAGACDERFGVVHGVVNVAAYTYRSTVFSETLEEWDTIMHTNVRGPYFLIQEAAAIMVREDVPGSIVNDGSTSGFGGQPKLASYAISKGALSVMTKNLAYALMRHRIRVNQVNPGWMDTDSEDRTQRVYDGAPANWLEVAEAGRPWARLVKPWEVANTIAFCLSEASGVMTGNLIDVDQSVRGAGDPPVPTWEETPQP